VYSAELCSGLALLSCQAVGVPTGVSKLGSILELVGPIVAES
jgi:hypothetical protein